MRHLDGERHALVVHLPELVEDLDRLCPKERITVIEAPAPLPERNQPLITGQFRVGAETFDDSISIAILPATSQDILALIPIQVTVRRGDIYIFQRSGIGL